ncbi:hypothetical protein K474DRAFT_1662759 [Panus rudis PR-1116 ss-1]|nr:hypothetical protein K474DRAFT_1662759 [Panus rudis PR-1116 ss-1]
MASLRYCKFTDGLRHPISTARASGTHLPPAACPAHCLPAPSRPRPFRRRFLPPLFLSASSSLSQCDPSLLDLGFNDTYCTAVPIILPAHHKAAAPNGTHFFVILFIDTIVV